MEPVSDTGFRERFFRSQDGLRLYWRDYGDPAASATPVFCLAGITRNSKDFHVLAHRLGKRRRVLALDYRGRGMSARDPNWRNYRPETYLADILDLMTVAGVHRAVMVGTSMGGLMAMALGALRPTVLAGVILNDVGPEISGEGFQRILDYIGIDRPVPDWDEAIAEMKRVFPDSSLDSPQQWLRMADASYRRGADGMLHFDWDVGLARALGGTADIPDLWRLYRSLGRLPVLAFRGALSDVLSEATFQRMADVKPDLRRVVVPDVGHVPSLDEPEARIAIDEFLSRF